MIKHTEKNANTNKRVATISDGTRVCLEETRPGIFQVTVTPMGFKGPTLEISELGREEARLEFRHLALGVIVRLEDWVRPAAPEVVKDMASARLYELARMTLLSNTGNSPYNCYHVNDREYRRWDAFPFTEEDIRCLQLSAMQRGQMVKITGQPGDRTIQVHTECDTSD